METADRSTVRRPLRLRFALLSTAIVALAVAAVLTVVILGSSEPVERAVRATATAFVIALPVSLAVIGCATWCIAGLVPRPVEGMADIAGYETQSRFMSNVAHELKTPISVILTQGQTLTRAGLDGETREFVESTIEEMRRLGRLVESFLTLTRVRAGRASHHREELRLNELVMESVEHCVAMARTYGVEIVPTLIDPEVDALVSGDADLLRTAIDNLVRNAITSSTSGDRLEITAGDDGDAWTVDVRDYGPGVAPELIDRFFDRLARVPEEQRRGRASGLGLEIAQGIVELHGGGITVTNESRGCRFRIRLPKAVAATS